MENEFLKNLNPHFYDPTKLAELIMSRYEGSKELRASLPLPSESEINEWAITKTELDRCTNEFYILMVVGDTTKVKKAKPFEFYSSFLRALAPRLSNMLHGHQSITSSEELIKVVERYVDLLDTDQFDEFARTYTERVFGGNPHEREILVANLWEKPLGMMMKTMTITFDMLIGCITDETEYITLGEGIVRIKHQLMWLKQRVNDGVAQNPRQAVESLLQEINTCWSSAKLEDNEAKTLALHDCWYELKQLHRSLLSESEHSEFAEQFFYEYMAQLMAIAGSVRQTGNYPPGSLPIDRMLRVTEREIAFGRLPENAPLHQNALKAKAEGKSDLIMDDIREELRRNPIIRMADAFSKVKKVKSFLRIFGM